MCKAGIHILKQALLPALDHLATTNHKVKWLVAVARRVEFVSVGLKGTSLEGVGFSLLRCS
jgi:hypothetical protein